MKKSLLQINGAVLLLGLVPLFAKWLPLASPDIIFFRCLFGAITLAAMVAWRWKGIRNLTFREKLAVLLLGVILGFHWVTYFQAIKVSTVAIGMTLLFTFPIMTVLIEPAVSGRSPSWTDFGLAVLAFGGVGIMVSDFSAGSGLLRGTFWGLISAFSFALRNVLHRKWLRQHQGSLMMFLQLVAATIFLTPFISFSVGKIDPLIWLELFLLGSIFTALAHSLFLSSMSELKAKTTSLIACLQPIYGILAAAIILHERPAYSTLLGASVVLTVSVIETIRLSSRKRAKTSL